MEHGLIKITEPLNARDLGRVFNFIFDNAMGNIIILNAVPTAVQMKANSMGIYGSDLYIKFANNVLLRFTGTVIA